MIDYWAHHANTAHLAVNVICTILTVAGLRLHGVSYWRILAVAVTGIALGGLAHAVLIKTPIVGASGGWFALLGYLAGLRFGVRALAGGAVIATGHVVANSYLGLLIHGLAYSIGVLLVSLKTLQERSGG